ncbi:nitronate monooxygenase [Pseudoxanthomonas sp.]|uniref:NAD(P)H-dependent flavin oxidoreductase n=1 Tax=Pseudoxanthomonas sp. TaxID=1871049 RepID=UPI00258A9C60|nr:nitronate monooxygenase [Pseudoxanthomonas sp.]MCR6687453.1 nitronate monooxygenase [Pseudoxanthomonas sp.]
MSSLPAALQDLELPVIQAPMAGVQDERLALAVSAAGGLGSVPCALLDLDALEALLERLAAQPLAVNLNFFCHPMAGPDPDAEQRWRQVLAPYYREFALPIPAPSTAGLRRPIDAAVVDLLERHQPPVLSFHFGLPAAPLLRRIESWGATVLASATTLEEGLWLQENGADLVIAQGHEAGGHRGHFLAEAPAATSTLELTRQLASALALPVVAAGGIAGPEDAARLRAAGACAVQAGTAYLLCPEADTSALHRRALQDAGRPTAITRLFSGRPARGIVNRLMRELDLMSPLPPPFPWASQALAPLRAAAEAAGRDDFSPLWSGSAGCRYAGMPAAEVTRDLAGVRR